MQNLEQMFLDVFIYIYIDVCISFRVPETNKNKTVEQKVSLHDVANEGGKKYQGRGSVGGVGGSLINKSSLMQTSPKTR